MTRIAYTEWNPTPATMRVVEQAARIIAAYQAQGFTLTLRQLYYQFVARDLLRNTTQSYKRLGGIVNDARLGGLLDWEAIEDRTRNLSRLPTWADGAHLVEAASGWFNMDLWASQEWRVEVWIEKEALAGVFEGVCEELRVPFFSCRGYTSQSEMWGAAQRMRGYRRKGYNVLLLHFGDHDPSGIDMTRDIQDRLALFGADVELRRVALNMEQVEEYSPPPNPAKVTDSRYAGYADTFGDESWELDALEPAVLAELVEENVRTVRDETEWAVALQEEAEERENLRTIASHYSAAVDAAEAEAEGA